MPNYPYPLPKSHAKPELLETPRSHATHTPARDTTVSIKVMTPLTDCIYASTLPADIQLKYFHQLNKLPV